MGRQPVGLVDQQPVGIRDDVWLAHDLTEPALESGGEGLCHLRAGIAGGIV